MRILALVPARGGSKRLPGKNIRPLGGNPLIVWSIDVAKGTREICDVLVSTDHSAIAEVALGAGALVPWLRPPELATDAASSVDVCLHALDWYEGEMGVVDGLLLLQPTVPFRSRSTVQRGINLFRERQRRPVLGVAPAQSHPLWCFRIEGETMAPFVDGEGLDGWCQTGVSRESAPTLRENAPVSDSCDRDSAWGFEKRPSHLALRSQELPPAYVVNGAFYLIAPGDLRDRGSFITDDMLPLVIEEPEESIDIDTEWDWKLAEAVLSMAGLE